MLLWRSPAVLKQFVDFMSLKKKKCLFPHQKYWCFVKKLSLNPAVGWMWVRSRQKGVSMSLDESSCCVAALKENSWKPLHLQSEVVPPITRPLSPFPALHSFSESYKHKKKLKKCFFLFLFFGFFLFSALFLSSPSSACHPPKDSAVCFNHSKLNGNTWRLVYSQIPRIPAWGHSVSHLCVALDFFCCSEMEKQLCVHREWLRAGCWSYVGQNCCGQSFFNLIFF